MKKDLWRLVLPEFSYGTFLFGCLVLAMAGCGSSYIPPAQPISVGLSVTAASVQAGIGTQSFTATVQYDSKNMGVTWTLTQAGANCAPACGSISASTSASGSPITYAAPSSQPNPSSVTLTASSVSDTSKSKAATVTVTPPVSVGVSPTPISVQFNAIQFFTATVQYDAANQGVNWTLTQAGTNCSSACGTISANTSVSGVPIKYTGPSGVPSNPAVTLTATAITDPARNAPAAITVTVNPSTTAVAISPLRAAITTGQTQSFTATVTGANVMTVMWEVDGTPGGSTASLGTIDSNGKYTPPTSGTLGSNHTITAVSNADITKNATAPIGVTDLPGVYTYHNDNSRTGANLKEFALTPSSVNTASFGKLFSCNVDAAVYAQPLWVANQNISGGTHNVVYVATQKNSVFAFDADSATCQILWQKSLNPAGETWVLSADESGCSDLAPNIGIVGTPVIDPVTGTLYLVSKTTNTTAPARTVFHQRLHALDVLTGNEKFSGPTDIQASVSGTGGGSSGGTLNFDPLNNGQRPALLLESDASGKHVVISWASHCDFGQYHGWVISYNAGTLAQQAIFNVSPNGTLGGIWMSGNGPAADSTGNIFFATGNGNWTGTDAYGDSIVKLGPQSAGLFGALDYFTPTNQANLEAADIDLGSGGVLMLPDLTGPNPHLLVQVGKEGTLYVVNRDNLGQMCSGSCSTGDTQIGQEIHNAVNGMWGSPAYWNSNLYFGGSQDCCTGDNLKAFSVTSGASQPLSTTPTSQSIHAFNFSGATPSVSASGTTNGIVWALDNSAFGSGCPGACQILYAYDATNLGTLFFDSTQAQVPANRDSSGGAVKFTVPTVANGKVYVGGQSTFSVYGLLPN